MKRGIEMSDTSARIHGMTTDVHMHPRIFDPRFVSRPDIPNGKAGVSLYSRTALKNGIQRGLFMPNETLRLYNPDFPDQTETHPYPITTPDRLLAALNVAESQSAIMAGMIFGVDPSIIGLDPASPKTRFTTRKINDIFKNKVVQDYTVALKIYGDETTGGFNIPLDHIIPVAEVWHRHNRIKPVIMHLEDEAVGQVLADWPAKIPAHIAHVSSAQELAAVIEAKESGKNVTCEATPHHLFLTEATRDALGAVGCMKPSLKKPEDLRFLWENLEYIDIFASDCAPHRLTDKFGADGQELEKPAFGVTNHDVFLPLFFQAIKEGLLSESQLYERIVVNSAVRFNLPEMPGMVTIKLDDYSAEDAVSQTPYGVSPFALSPETPQLVGPVTYVVNHLGSLMVRNGQIAYEAQPRPENLIKL
ncbi:MAG TPA: hypothetical protein VG964_01335 [Candidatus Saccharimonadales bacterium]|nr:hypothetical protein [Candidatus Saccharimonadales bacterium]